MDQFPDTLAVAGVDAWDSYLSLAVEAGILQRSSGQNVVYSLDPDFYARLAEFQASASTDVDAADLEILLDGQRMRQWDNPLQPISAMEAPGTGDEGGKETSTVAEEEVEETPQQYFYGVTDLIWADQRDVFAPAAQAQQEPSPTQIAIQRRNAAKELSSPLEAFAPLINNLLQSGCVMSSSIDTGQLFSSRFPGVFKLANTLGWKAYLRRAEEVGILVDVPEEEIVELQPDFWITLLDLHLVSKGKLQRRSDSEVDGHVDLSPAQAHLYQVIREQGSAWTVFEPLISVLHQARERGDAEPLRLHVRTGLSIEYSELYPALGLSGFDQYMTLAEAAGLALAETRGTKRFALDARWYARLLQAQRAAFPTTQEAMQGLFTPSSALARLDEADTAPMPLADDSQAEFRAACAALPTARAGIQTNALYTFMPLVDMMLAHGHPRHGPIVCSQRWVRAALDANFESLYSKIGVDGFDGYVHLAKVRSLPVH